ncbi:MAG: hypothetical protein HDT47_09780 [Ruminococcaceae bacterium]|nr:hypothetical protein [Oscillospiraceae bacterium]
MKNIEFTEDNIIISKKAAVKLLKTIFFLTVGIISFLLCMQIRYIVFDLHTRHFVNNITLIIAGAVTVFCANKIFLEFTKATGKKKVLVGVIVSLLLGIKLCDNHLCGMMSEGTIPGLETNATATVLVVSAIHLLYAAVVFAAFIGFSKLITKIGSRCKNFFILRFGFIDKMLKR